MIVDVVVDLAFGDSGKGKVVHHLLKREKYTHCLRFSGGGNCGHSLYENGKKIVTHFIPSGVVSGVKSIIGPGCVINIKKLKEEMQTLKEAGVENIESLVKIAYNAHIITDEHALEDSKDIKIGTTKTGNGPAYRDKYSRIGIRAENVPELKEFLIDTYDEFFNNSNVKILCEGAQGFYLDIDHGDYPYVTSSHCTVAGALLNGIPHTAIRKVYGVAKIYTTYVGNKKFQPDGEIFKQIAQLGNEYGATTGRLRQVNFLNINDLIKAININNVTDLIINKMDILRQLNKWFLTYNNNVIEFDSEHNIMRFIFDKIISYTSVKNIKFSDSPERI